MNEDTPSTRDCYMCSRQVTGGDLLFPFCSEECKERYWEHRDKRFNVKPKLSIAQIQERLKEMGEKARKNYKPTTSTDVYDIAKEIFG